MNINFDKIPGMFSIEGEPDIVKNIRAKILDKFKDLIFYEGPHIYKLYDKTLPSVTTILNKFEEPFNADEKAYNYALKHGETKEYWLDKWKFNNLKSTTTGTLVHSYGESMFYVKCKHPELITEENKCKFYKNKQWLIPTRPKEEAIYKFYEKLHPNLYPLLAEAKMFTEGLKQDLAGTADILFYYDDPSGKNRGVVIMDYKTNADIHSSYARNMGVKLLSPFENYIAEPESIYTLQLSAYSIPLQDLGLNIIARRLIWLKDDGTYELIPLKDESDKLRAIL